MHAALKLSPFFAFELVLIYVIFELPQFSEYLIVVSELGEGGFTTRLVFQLIVNFALYLIFIYFLGRSIFSIATRQLERSRANNLVLFAGSLVLLLGPGWALFALFPRPLNYLSSSLGIFILVVTLAVIPICAYASGIGLAAFSQLLDKIAPQLGRLDLGLVILLFLVPLFHAFDIVEASHFTSLIGVTFAACGLLFVAVYWVGHFREKSIPVLSVIIIALLITYLIPTFLERLIRPNPEEGEQVSSNRELEKEHKKQLKKRNILSVAEGFEKWLEERQSDLDEFREKKKRKYPVFLVAAQGGGYYAAYHSALYLARLQDNSSKFANHVFAISGVSGGSLGGALFAESVRRAQSGQSFARSKTASPSCDAKYPKSGDHEKVVRCFFDFDFLTPVIAAGLFFDVPRAVLPQLKLLGLDRGEALVQSFDRAWRSAIRDEKKDEDAFSRDFYGVWKPKDNAPALFLNTTSVNTGNVTVASQLHLNAYPIYSTVQSDSDDKEFQHAIADARPDNTPEARSAVSQLIAAFKERHYKPPLVSNILDFRPDIELKLGQAVRMSAGFPIISPTARYPNGDATPRDKILSTTEELQLVDGGYYDNSGLFTVRYILEEIIQVLKKNAEIIQIPKEKKWIENVELHIISFTHDPDAFYETSSTKGFAELVSPIAAFEMTRQTRSRDYDAVIKEAIGQRHKKIQLFVHKIELFDRSFQAPLSWFLSKKTKRSIELRSGYNSVDRSNGENISREDEVCCNIDLTNFPGAPVGFGGRKLQPRFKYVANREEGESLDWLRDKEPFINRIQPFVPNKEAFDDIVNLIRYGGDWTWSEPE